jgi:hypothetical protein
LGVFTCAIFLATAAPKWRELVHLQSQGEERIHPRRKYRALDVEHGHAAPLLRGESRPGSKKSDC